MALTVLGCCIVVFLTTDMLSTCTKFDDSDDEETEAIKNAENHAFIGLAARFIYPNNGEVV